MQLAFFIAGKNHGLTTDVWGVVVIVIRNLRLMSQIDPVALKDVLHLKLEQLFVSEGATMQTINPFFTVLF